MWNYEVKTPVDQLDNYLYTMPCEIGDVTESSGAGYTNKSTCVFDTTTKYSSSFSSAVDAYTVKMYNPTYSSTAVNNQVVNDFWTLGLSFEGT